MEELLVQQLGEDFMLALVLFKARQGVEAFVNDPDVYPGGREATEVGAFAAFVDALFFDELFSEQELPARVHFLRDLLYDL